MISERLLGNEKQITRFVLAGLPSIITERTVIGSTIPAQKIYTYTGKTTPFCNFEPTGRASRVKHELAHQYYFVCITCPSIKQSNDTMQKSHASMRCDDHHVVIVERIAQEQFLQWLESDGERLNRRQNFFIQPVEGVPILCCKK